MRTMDEIAGIDRVIDKLERSIYYCSVPEMKSIYPVVEQALAKIDSIIGFTGENFPEPVLPEEELFDSARHWVIRLDRLAAYSERSGHKYLAYRVDMISDRLAAGREKPACAAGSLDDRPLLSPEW